MSCTRFSILSFFLYLQPDLAPLVSFYCINFLNTGIMVFLLEYEENIFFVCDYYLPLLYLFYLYFPSSNTIHHIFYLFSFSQSIFRLDQSSFPHINLNCSIHLFRRDAECQPRTCNSKEILTQML